MRRGRLSRMSYRTQACSTRLPTVCPCAHGQHLHSRHAIHGHAAEDRGSVALYRLHPRVRMLAVTPAQSEHCVSESERKPLRRLECWIGASLKRIAPSRYRRPVVQRHSACTCQVEVATLAVNGDALDPASRAASGSGHVQFPAVPTQARPRDGSHCSVC